MVESGLFTFFSRLAQAYVWTKTKAFYQSCTLRFLDSGEYLYFFYLFPFNHRLTIRATRDTKVINKDPARSNVKVSKPNIILASFSFLHRGLLDIGHYSSL